MAAAAKSSYDYEDLLACARGDLFGPGNAQLPCPPMLMFDRITEISETGGAFDKGLIRAEFDIKPDLTGSSPATSSAIRSCRAASGLDAMWQMTGLLSSAGLGEPGKGMALSTGEVEVQGHGDAFGEEAWSYGVDFKRVMRGTPGARHRRWLVEGRWRAHIRGDRPQGRPVQQVRPPESTAWTHRI